MIVAPLQGFFLTNNTFTPGFTGDHRCLVPSELGFTSNSSPQISWKTPADQKE
jgi:hypothetical protein